jgi:hypothetical protein
VASTDDEILTGLNYDRVAFPPAGWNEQTQNVKFLWRALVEAFLGAQDMTTIDVVDPSATKEISWIFASAIWSVAVPDDWPNHAANVAETKCEKRVHVWNRRRVVHIFSHCPNNQEKEVEFNRLRDAVFERLPWARNRCSWLRWEARYHEYDNSDTFSERLEESGCVAS